MSTLNDKRPAYIPLAKRDRAKQEFLKDKTCFGSVEERSDFLVEQMKNSVLSDLRSLSARIGLEATKDFVKSEFTDLAF